MRDIVELGRGQSPAYGESSVPVLRGEEAVAAAQRKAAFFPDGGGGDDVDGEFQLLGHRADDLELLPVLFAEDRGGGVGEGEEAGDDLADAGEVAGAVGVFELGLGGDGGEGRYGDLFVG